ncbi:MAG: carbohydrate ABC transporter permease [Anaerolineae bacterium]
MAELAATEPKSGRLRFNINDPQWLGLTLIAPTFGIVLGFLLFPFLYALVLSFMHYNLSNPNATAFIRIENYLELLTDRYFISAVQRTIVFSIVSVVLEVLLGISIAIVLDQKFRFQGLMRGLIILPWALPTVVNGIMWKWIYNADYGALNALLTQLGVLQEYQVWLADPNWAMALVIFANVWKETPFTVILVLAALQGIPAELYEAGKVDGTSAWQSLWHITLPLLRPVIMIAALLQVIWGFQTFDLIYIVTSGGPFNSTELVAYRLYLQTFKFFEFGYGSAMAYMVTLFLLIPAIFYIRSAYRNIVEY